MWQCTAQIAAHYKRYYLTKFITIVHSLAHKLFFLTHFNQLCSIMVSLNILVEKLSPNQVLMIFICIPYIMQDMEQYWIDQFIVILFSQMLSAMMAIWAMRVNNLFLGFILSLPNPPLMPWMSSSFSMALFWDKIDFMFYSNLFQSLLWYLKFGSFLI